MEPISRKYRDRIMRMMGVSLGQTVVSDKNVHQVGNAEMLSFIDSMISENLLLGSGIRGMEHIEELLAAATAGEPCLLLLEHYSNFDLPVLHYLLRHEGPSGVAAANALLAIAGIKLNESNPVVLAFTEAYTRLVIYPSRSVEIIQRNSDGVLVKGDVKPGDQVVTQGVLQLTDNATVRLLDAATSGNGAPTAAATAGQGQGAAAAAPADPSAPGAGQNGQYKKRQGQAPDAAASSQPSTQGG